MRLGVKLSLRDGAMVAVSVDSDGSVSGAGGKAGDVWSLIDDEPALDAYDGWQNGSRARRPGVPLKVGILRDGRHLTIRPTWRSNQGEPTGIAPCLEPRLAETIAGVTANEAAGAACPDAQAIPTARGATPATTETTPPVAMSIGLVAEPALTMTERFQNDRGQPMRHPDHEAALRLDREGRRQRERDIYRADDPNYDPFRP